MGGVAVLVEDLDRGTLATQRIGMRPAAGEQPQVDIRAEHQDMPGAGGDIDEVAMALMHRMLVARQAHDAAEPRHGGE